MADLEADLTQLDQFIGQLQRGSHRAFPEAAKAVRDSARNIERDWWRRWSGHPHFPALPNAVTHDVREFGHTVDAEIGPDKQRPQGPLGNLIEFGSRNNAPIPGGLPALAAEAPRLERTLGDLAEKLFT